ncbi:MAG: hypothetical protein C0432_04545 [Candidatus Puniceispirillum sp.]|nr:hypothetical protein [Candidatus Pelagibacter sp.]MBA4283545.1 hypothetical protein [Candidatus Puniceispirillum sp.]
MSVLDLYTRLSSHERLYLNLICIFPQIPSKTALIFGMQSCMETQSEGSGVAHLFKNQMKSAEIERIKKELIEQKILNEEENVQPLKVDEFTKLTFSKPQDPKIWEIADQILDKFIFDQRYDQKIKLRIAIYQNNEIDFENLIQNLNTQEQFDFFNTYFHKIEFDPQWFLNQHTSIRFYFSRYFFKFLIDHDNQYKVAHDFFKHMCKTNTDCTLCQLYHMLFHENGDSSEKNSVKNLPELWKNIQSIYALNAESITSLRSFWKSPDLNIKELNAFYPDDRWIKYTYYLSLICENTKSSIDKLISETAVSDGKGDKAFLSLAYAIQGLQSKVKTHELDQDFFNIFDSCYTMLCIFYIDSSLIKVEALKTLVSEVDSSKIHFLKKMVRDIIEAVKDKEGFEEFSSVIPLNKKSIFSFTHIVQKAEAWKLSLKNLDEYVNQDEGSLSALTSRLAWIFDLESNQIVEVLEQNYLKHKWSKGRPVALKTLYDFGNLSYITTQDMKIIKTIRKERNNTLGVSHYYLDPILSNIALTGHPNVYRSDNLRRPLVIREAKPELIISQFDADSLKIELSHVSKTESVFVDREGPYQLVMVHIHAGLIKLVEIIGEDGLIIPADNLDFITAIAQKAQKVVSVSSDLINIGLTYVEPNSAPVIMLEPLGENGSEGLQVSLHVRPFGDKGIYCTPALGRGYCTFENTKTNRDFVSERYLAEKLIRSCSSLSNEEHENYEWYFKDIQQCYELISDLKEYEEFLRASNEELIRIEWPKGKKISMKQPLSVKHSKFSVTESKNWFHVDGALELDDARMLSLRELIKLVQEQKNRFISLGDNQLLALRKDLFQTLLRLQFLDSDPEGDQLKLNATSLSVLDTDELFMNHLTDKTPLSVLSQLVDKGDREYKVPADLHAVLRPYQEEGVKWLLKLADLKMGACLADDMGLGKTIQSIAALLKLAENGPSLVVAPTSVCYNWHEEIKKFAPRLSVKFFEPQNRKQLIEDIGPNEILVCSYNLLQQEITGLEKKHFACIILDEAQSIKNYGTKRAQSAFKLKSDFRLALSGTPIENGLEELWSIFRFIMPQLLGGRDTFVKKYISGQDKGINKEKREILKSIIKGFILRRTKIDVLKDLPPKVEQTIYVTMEDEERNFYEAVRQSALESLSQLDDSSPHKKIHILAELTKLRRACCHPRLIEENFNFVSGKSKYFMDLIEELISSDHKALVFSQYVSYLELLRKELDAKGIQYEYLDGKTPSHERQKRVQGFQEGNKPLFLLSLKAGGSGLNLTAADYVIHLDPWWNPAVESQASDRAHRMGQKKSVTVIRVIMKNTIEEKILALHEDKKNLANDILDGIEIPQKLTEKDLMELLMVA